MSEAEAERAAVRSGSWRSGRSGRAASAEPAHPKQQDGRGRAPIAAQGVECRRVPPPATPIVNSVGADDASQIDRSCLRPTPAGVVKLRFGFVGPHCCVGLWVGAIYCYALVMETVQSVPSPMPLYVHPSKHSSAHLSKHLSFHASVHPSCVRMRRLLSQGVCVMRPYDCLTDRRRRRRVSSSCA